MNGRTIGGDLIGTGSFGCVVKPALECIGQTKGHIEENCYANTYNDGDVISDSEEEYEEFEIWSCEYC